MFMFSANMGCDNKKQIVIIEKPTELLEKPDRKDSPRNRVIAQLNKGVRAEVIHTRYSKEYMFYKIRTEDGLVGYVMWDPSVMREVGAVERGEKQ